jgi:hypothetical protein
MNPAEAVIDLISSRLTDDGDWSVSTDELEQVMGAVHLYRAVYQSRLVSQDRFGPDNVGELLTLLETAGSDVAERSFRQAGLALNHHDRVAVTERFVRHLQRQIVLHLPQPETFRFMIQDLRRYELAETAYCEEFLPVEPVVVTCAAEHAEGHSHSETLTATVCRYLRSLVSRRFVLHQDLAPALFDLLRTVARQEGLLPPIPDEAQHEMGRAMSEEEVRRAAALQVFGFDRMPSRREDLQSAYRQLMRTYHPDINPNGLEMSKRINGAYAQLITSGAWT